MARRSQAGGWSRAVCGPGSSRPGQPPRLRTGTGRGQVVWEYNGNQQDPAVRVGVKKKGIYMAYLELGTRRIAPRPWLLATLQRSWRMLARLAVSGGKEIK